MPLQTPSLKNRISTTKTTMSKRTDFPKILPKTHTKYCFNCGEKTIEKINYSTITGIQTKFLCTTCKNVSGQVKIWDPNMIQYFDEEENLIHEGAGMII